MIVTKRSLFYWVKTSNLKLQACLLVSILVTVAARVLPLEMQKRIVNLAIGMKRVDLLLMYCGFYIAAVVAAGGLKYIISLLQTYIGQEALSRIRRELYAHILTLPLVFFRQASSGMVVSSLVTEVSTAGDFIGQAIAVPVTNLLTLVAFAAYMFHLNPLLAALSMAIYPFIVFIVPKLQARSNTANKERVDCTRLMSSRVGEVISGMHEIKGNASNDIENRKYGRFVEKLFKIRVTWILYKQGVKVLNNFFQSLGPFVLFLVGGYLAINGRFDLGALVAFLSAYEKLYDPWKELLDFYQVYEDARVTYSRIMEYFDAQPEALLDPPDRAPYALRGEISVKDVSLTLESGIQLLKNVSLELKAGEQLAVVGFSGSGKSTLAQCIGQLYQYTSGSIRVDGREVSELTKKDIAHTMGIVAQSPFIFDGTIKENLLYSCEALLEGGEIEEGSKFPSLDEMIQVLQQVGIFVDVLRFGLNTLLPPTQRDLVEQLIRIRHSFQENFGSELADSVEFFDETRFNLHFTVAANLSFGNPREEGFTLNRLPHNESFNRFLDEARLRAPLEELGRGLATQAVDILGNLPLDELFFRQSPIPMEEFEAYKALVERLPRAVGEEVSPGDRLMLLKLALGFIPGLHKMVAMPPDLERMLLDARPLLRETIERECPGAVNFYRVSDYLHDRTILDNILFGAPRSDHPGAWDSINQSVIQLLIEEDLLERIIEIGMNFEVGVKGDRLSGGQRQKLAIARVFLKNPPVLIMDEASSALDNASQQRIQNVLKTKWKGRSTLVSVVHRLDIVKDYDKIAVMQSGKVIEIGAYGDLMARKGVLYGLVHGTKAGA
jgi:ABC-type multidrug transport system fused ATPase/permease subunit